MEYLLQSPVKALADWELDVLAIPFDKKDSDEQWFDAETDIMHEAFTTPLIVHQHGIKNGGRAVDEKPVVLGRTVPGSLEKRADGWHVRVILNKTIKLAQEIFEAAKRGLVAVSSGAISHLARLEVGGKIIQYQKNIPGRIAVWSLAEISLWKLGNGNVRPASSFAIALPVMKAIYRDAGISFPDLDTHGVSEADKARRAKVEKVKKNAEKILKGFERSRRKDNV
jgi:hypothetical protein